MNHTIHIDKAPKGVWITLDNDIRVKFQQDGHSSVELEIPEPLPVSAPTTATKDSEYDLPPSARQLLPADDHSSPDAEPKAAYSARSIPESSFWLG